MSSKPTFEEQLDSLGLSDRFRVWQEELTDCFYDQEAKDRLIHKMREEVEKKAKGLSKKKVEKLREAVTQRLVSLASKDAERPREHDELEPPDRSQYEIEDIVIDEFPYPIGICYRHLAEAESPGTAFGCLLDTFESLLYFLTVTVLSAYWRSGASDPDHNCRLLEKFYKGKWSTGDLMELLRETVRLYLDSPDTLPYPQLVRYLFTLGGKPTSSLKVLEGFVELRNRAWAHAGGRDNLFYSGILETHRKRLDYELNRCDWLTDCVLWLPKEIDDDGRVTTADLLNGDRRRRNRKVSLQLNLNDLDINGGDVVPEQTPLLVNKETNDYLPLFPLSLFRSQQKGQGVFFLNHLDWAAKSEMLKKARYLAYEPLLDQYETRAGELAVNTLEAKIHLMEESVQQRDEEERIRELSREAIVGLRFTDVGDIFKDREDKLAELKQHLKDKKVKFICITGRGGIGKTALVSKVCAEIESGELQLSDTTTAMGTDGIIYVSCRSTDKVTVERLYYDISRVLGSPHDEKLRNYWRDTSRSIADKTRFLLSKLQDGCYLLVLDNFEDALASDNTIEDQELRTFFDLCLTTPNALKLIATSRERVVIGGQGMRLVRNVSLDKGLPDAESISLLRELDPDGELGLLDTSDKLLQNAVRRCYNVPRALETIAGILSSVPTLNLTQLLDDTALFNEQVVENLIAEHYRRITEDQKRVLEALAVYNKPVSADAVSYLMEPFFPNVDVDAYLSKLALNYFVTYQRGRDSYELHPLDRDYAYSCISDEGDNYTKRSLHNRAGKFYLNHAEEIKAREANNGLETWDISVERQWVESVGQAVEHFFVAEAWQDLAQAHDTVKMFYTASLEDFGYIQECADICRRMLHAARLMDDPSEEAVWLHEWGAMNDVLGNYTVAEESCLQALEIARSTDQEKLQMHILERLGSLMTNQGKCEQARKWYEQRARLVGKPMWRWHAVIFEKVGNLDKALEFQKKALEAASQRDSDREILSSRYLLAKILRKQGNYTEAENALKESIKLARQLEFPHYLAFNLLEAGRIALSINEYDRAQKFLDESQEIVAFPSYKAKVFHALGMLNHHLSNFADARRYYENALAFDFTFTNYSCTVKLGILCLEEGKKEEARDYFARGITLCNELLEKTPRLYDVLYHLALAQLGRGKSDDALATYQRALEVCSAKGVVQSALQDLQLLKRTPQPIAGLDKAIQLLEGVMDGKSG